MNFWEDSIDGDWNVLLIYCFIFLEYRFLTLRFLHEGDTIYKIEKVFKIIFQFVRNIQWLFIMKEKLIEMLLKMNELFLNLLKIAFKFIKFRAW